MFSCLTSEHFHTHQNYGDDDDDVLYIRTRIEDSLVHIRGEYVPKYEINFQPQNCMHKSSLDIALWYKFLLSFDDDDMRSRFKIRIIRWGFIAPTKYQSGSQSNMTMANWSHDIFITLPSKKNFIDDLLSMSMQQNGLVNTSRSYSIKNSSKSQYWMFDRKNSMFFIMQTCVMSFVRNLKLICFCNGFVIFKTLSWKILQKI
jgi:hypothetical protein